MAKAKKLPEIEITAADTDSPPAECRRAVARWSDDAGNRYHAWLLRNGSSWYIGAGLLTGKPEIYKNPPTRVDRRDPGHFRTRHLDAEAAAHRAVAEEVLRLANQTSAIQDSAEARLAELKREQAMERHKDAVAIREAFNRALADSFAAGEINRNKFTELVDLANDLPDESWLTLGRAVRKA